jgi:hypothetical protein
VRADYSNGRRRETTSISPPTLPVGLLDSPVISRTNRHNLSRPGGCPKPEGKAARLPSSPMGSSRNEGALRVDRRTRSAGAVRQAARLWLARLLPALLAIVVFGTSSRSLFAPKFSARLQESRRPRPPRHLITTSTRQLARTVVMSQAPMKSRSGLSEHAGWTECPVPGFGRSLPAQAFDEMAKPGYLNASSTSLPQSQTSPPA